MKDFGRKVKNILLRIVPLILIIVITTAISEKSKLKDNSKEEITYNKFIQMVETKEIKKVLYIPSETKITFEDKNEKEFITDNPKTDGFKKFLLENGIEVDERSMKTSTMVVSVFLSFLQLSFMGAILVSIIKTTNMGSNFGEVFNKKGKNIPDISFKDVAGYEEIKEDMEGLVDFLKEPEKYTKRGAKLTKGVILYGEPGTGKTLMAKALAGECGVPFISVNGSDFVEMFVGLGSRKIRSLFKQARKQSPCIIFIDEIDSIGGERDKISHGEQEQTLNQLLTEMDGFVGNEGILVIAATNRFDTLDKALIRPGRFDKHIGIRLPNIEERKKIIEVHLEGKKFEENFDINRLAKETVNFSGAKISTLLNESVINSVKNGKEYADYDDINKVFIEMELQGKIRKTSLENEKEMRIKAYHEIGHALVSKILIEDDVISKISIISNTSGYGGFVIYNPNESVLISLREMKNYVKRLYGGYAGELIYSGDREFITSGSSQDIERATQILKSMITQYGVSEKYGLINTNILEIDNTEIIEEVSEMSNKLFEETLELLQENKNLIEYLVEELVSKEMISGEEFDNLIETYNNMGE